MRDPQPASRRRRPVRAPHLVRRLRHDPAVVLPVFAAILVISTVVAATPRLVAAAETDALQGTVADAPAVLRNLSQGRASRISASRIGEPFRNVDRIGERFFDGEMPPSVQELIDGATFVVSSPRFDLNPLPGKPAWSFTGRAHLRYQQEVEDHIELVAGAYPQPREDPISVEFPPEDELAPAGDAEPVEPRVEMLQLIEVAAGSAVLDDLGLAVGDRMLINPDSTDRNQQVVALQQLNYRMVIEIVGVVAATDPAEAYWFDDLALVRPRQFANPDFAIITPSFLISPDDYELLLRRTNGALWDYTWRYFTAPERFDPATVDRVTMELDDLIAEYRAAPQTAFGRTSLTTGLDRLIEGYFDERRSAEAVLGAGLVGLATAGASVAFLLVALIAARRDRATHLLRSRGASRRQLTGSAFLEGVLISLPAVALGLLLAEVLVPGQPGDPGWQLGLGVVAAAAAIMALGAQTPIRRRLGTTRGEELVRSPSLRRAVAGAAVVVLAVVAVLLVRRRSLDEPAAGFDLLVAATPALLAAAGGVVLLGLYPHAVRVASRLAAARRDLVAFVGLRRVLLQAPANRLPVVVVTIVAAVVAVVSSWQLSIDRNREAAIWHEVGADYRIAYADDTTPLPRGLDLSGVDVIEHVAAGLRFEATPRTQGGRSAPIEVLAVDAAAYAVVTRGSPAGGLALSGTVVGAGAGTDANPFPAVASAGWAAGAGLAPGDRFSLDLGTVEPTFEISALLETFPSIELETPFVLTDLATIQGLSRAPRQPTALYVRAPRRAAGSLAELLAAQAPAVRLHDRALLTDTISEAPLAKAVSRGLWLVFGVGATFAILAVVAAFALTSESRRRQLAYLRTMGLSDRQAQAITVIETLPPVLIAATTGSVLGWVAAVAVAPALDLAPFIGPGGSVTIEPAVAGNAALVVALGAAVGVATWLSGRAARAANLATVLRRGSE